MKWPNLFHRRDRLKEQRLNAIDIVNRLKDAVNSPFLTFATKIIPGDKDDKLLKAVREALPAILRKWNLTKRQTLDVALFDAITALKESEDRPVYYRTIAGEIYSLHSGLPPDTAMDQVEREYKPID